jgi:SAP domain
LFSNLFRLQDNDLRKKCREEGLSSKGDRKALISRHQRFTLLYNAECDLDKPRSVIRSVAEPEPQEAASFFVEPEPQRGAAPALNLMIFIGGLLKMPLTVTVSYLSRSHLLPFKSDSIIREKVAKILRLTLVCFHKIILLYRRVEVGTASNEFFSQSRSRINMLQLRNTCHPVSSQFFVPVQWTQMPPFSTFRSLYGWKKKNKKIKILYLSPQ